MTRLQDLSDDEFVRLVDMHTSRLTATLRTLEDLRLVNGMLQAEAVRRARRAAAVPAAVDAELRAILDKSW
mgnify:CR=1 FL=1